MCSNITSWQSKSRNFNPSRLQGTFLQLTTSSKTDISTSSVAKILNKRRWKVVKNLMFSTTNGRKCHPWYTRELLQVYCSHLIKDSCTLSKGIRMTQTLPQMFSQWRDSIFSTTTNHGPSLKSKLISSIKSGIYVPWFRSKTKSLFLEAIIVDPTIF